MMFYYYQQIPLLIFISTQFSAPTNTQIVFVICILCYLICVLILFYYFCLLYYYIYSIFCFKERIILMSDVSFKIGNVSINSTDM